MYVGHKSTDIDWVLVKITQIYFLVVMVTTFDSKITYVDQLVVRVTLTN